MCNKMSFDSKTEALVESKRLKDSRFRTKFYVKNSKKMIAYMCRNCGNYHLTSKKKITKYKFYKKV